MKPRHHCVLILGSSITLCFQSVQGAEIFKLFDNKALNLPIAWNGGVVPGVADVAVWNIDGPPPVNATNLLPPLGGDLSFAGIKITDVAGTRNLAPSYIGYFNASSVNTLTIGAGGIDCSVATQTFYGSSKVTIAADQSWSVGNANTAASPAGFNNNEDIAFHSQGAGVPFNFGGKTVTTSGAGQVTVTSGYTLSNGTLNVGNDLFVIQGGTSRVTNLSSDLNVVVTSGRLRLQSNSGAANISLVSAAPATVNAGSLELLQNSATNLVTQNGNLTLNEASRLVFLTNSGGPISATGSVAINGSTTIRNTGGGVPVAGTLISGNLTGAGTITYQNEGTGASARVNLTGNNSGYTGTFNISGASGNRSLSLASATAGSAAATWNVATDNSLVINGVTAELGTLLGAGMVTNSSDTTPATINVGAGSFSGIISDGLSQLTGVNKVGPGALSLSGANTYSGPTTVTAGQLAITTSQFPLSPADFSAADAATLTVAQMVADSTLLANNLTVGATTGATFEVALGSQVNPTFAPVDATNLLVNGAGILKISGSNLTVGNFPAIKYASLGGSTGFGGLTLKLPARTTGSLSNVSNTVRVTIASTQQVKWNGDLSNNWDIDPDGSQTQGTANWKTTVTNTATRYLQGSGGTDIVTFNDTATGSGTVNLTTVLSPGGLTVNNSTKAYTFTGPGKITGTIGLVKSGTGSLTLANTTANDYSGGTLIQAGTLRLGDGVTVGGGIISGSIVNDGTLVLNRPSDFVFSNPLSGIGSLEKAAPNTVTIGSFVFPNSIALTAGKLLFNGGGTLSGVISGSGQLEVAGGTLTLDGADANSFTGAVAVSAGKLTLQKAPDTQAVGGDITITGAGTLALLSNEQIADTATLNVFGNSADVTNGSTGTETLANINLSGAVPESQMILRNFGVVTGTATVTQGILGVASSNTGSINKVVMTSPTAMLRVAGSGGPSTMNIGSGGITASAGEIQVKFNVNDQDATFSLDGGLTTTGNLAFTNAGYTGAFLNVISLTDGSHAFNIGAATTTTVAPDIGGPGGLVKSGDGTLKLNDSCVAAHGGGTTVSAGSLIVNGSITGAASVAVGGTLGGKGVLNGTTSVLGTIAPGDTAGTLTTSAPISFGGGSSLAIDIADWAGTTAGTDWDLLAANTLTLTATPASKLTLRVAGSPANFTESAKTLVIATSVNPLSGFNAAAITVDSSAFSGNGTFTVQKTGDTLELVYAAGEGSPYTDWAAANGLDGTNNAPTFDAENDGLVNFLEFALNSNPLSGASSGKLVGKVATVGGEQVLTLTIPVLSQAPFTGATEKSLAVDGLVYHVQASDALGTWDQVVTEVIGTDASTIQFPLPPLQSGWFYRTFRSPGPVAGDPAEFLRVRVDSTN